MVVTMRRMTTGPQVDQGSAEHPATPRLAGDVRRSWWALAIAVPIVLVLSLVVGPPRLATEPSSWLLDRNFVLLLVCDCLLFFGVYQILTWRVFRHLDAPELATVVRATTPRGRRAKLARAASGGGGTSWAVQAALLALAAVLAIALQAELREDWVVFAAAATLAVVSWSMVVVAYALAYVREHCDHPGLRFPGDAEPEFTDYLYLACQISTTFSSSDVQVTSPRMRRIVTGHALVAFAFNSIIVALLVSIVLVLAA